MWDTLVFLHQSPKNIFLPPVNTPLFRLHLFVSLTGRAIIDDLSVLEIVELSKSVEENIFSMHIQDIGQRLFPILLTQKKLGDFIDEKKLTGDSQYVSTIIDILDLIKAENPALFHGYREDQILALIALNVCAQSTLLYRKKLAPTHNEEHEDLSDPISDDEAYLDMLRINSVISDYEQSISLAVELMTFAKATHSLKLATSLSSSHAKKILSEHAKLTIGHRHSHSHDLQKQFIAYFEKNRDNDTFKTIEQAASQFYDALPDNMKIYRESNATRTLIDALRRHRKGHITPPTN
jgi:hypothetical protein